MQLAELMSLCTNLHEKVLDLEKAKTAQAKEIISPPSLICFVIINSKYNSQHKELENRRKSRTSGLRRLRKVGSFSRIESSNDASLGAQEDAYKQGRKIKDLNADTEVTLPVVSVATTTKSIPVSAVEVVTTASASVVIPDELTLAQTLIEIKTAKLKPLKIDEHVEVEKDDQEEAKMKRHIEIVKDDKVAINAIPLATKLPMVVEYQIDKDGRIGYFK
ncbi:hypothetical protein Tco_1315531 [Tanacetum coccineum]